MMNFIYDLYKNDHFTMYLTIILVVLIILFVVVLLLGKKDQKLEETKRLQKIELEKNTFKETEEPLVKLEVPETPVIKEEPKKVKEIVLQPVEDEKVELPTLDNQESLINFVSDNDNKDENDVDIDLSSLFSIKDEIDKIELPAINKEEPAKVESVISVNEDVEEVKPEVKAEVKPEKVFRPSQVFSSVYVNNNNSVNSNLENNVNSIDNTNSVSAEKFTQPHENTISINTLNNDESPVDVDDENDKTSIKLFTIEDDEDDMELPSLKG